MPPPRRSTRPEYCRRSCTPRLNFTGSNATRFLRRNGCVSDAPRRSLTRATGTSLPCWMNPCWSYATGMGRCAFSPRSASIAAWLSPKAAATAKSFSAHTITGVMPWTEDCSVCRKWTRQSGLTRRSTACRHCRRRSGTGLFFAALRNKAMRSRRRWSNSRSYCPTSTWITVTQRSATPMKTCHGTGR